MSTDRELLELAAKAAGVPILGPVFGMATDSDIQCFSLPKGQYWNPLTDDGDALRLAVKLGIAIQLHPAWVYARAVEPHDHYCWREITEGWGKGGDPYAATRRAIVRAAAEIGRRMV